jgi:hypothetical protein
MAQNYDFSKMNITQLKDTIRALKKQGHKITLSGNKNELLAKINQVYGIVEQQGVPPPVAQIPQTLPNDLPTEIPQEFPAFQTVPPPVEKVKAPKNAPKDPVAIFCRSVRDADQTLEMAIRTVLEAYGLMDKLNEVEEIFEDEWNNKPVPMETPKTEAELRVLRVVDLKKILKDNNQKYNGNKEELIQRILNPEAENQGVGFNVPPPNVGDVPAFQQDAPTLPDLTDFPVPPPTNMGVNLPEVPNFPGAVMPPAFPVPGNTEEKEMELPTSPATMPTLPTFPAVETTLPTFPAVETTLPTFPTAQPTLPTFPTAQPTLPTFPTAQPTLPALPTV